MRFLLLFGYALMLSGCSTPPPSSSREIRVAAAADLKFAFEDIARAFEKDHPGIVVKATYGSSGNFFAQLSRKAPFDLFLSADVDFPRQLVEQGHAEKGSEFTYARGHLVVWQRKESPLEVETLGMQTLLDARVKTIAIANPKFAPYGRAAEASLKKLVGYDVVKDRLVLGENIAQAAQFVDRRAADVGVLALSLVSATALRDKGRYWRVPDDAYPPLLQGGVILADAKDVDAAQQLRTYLLSKPGREILQKHHFDPPGE